MAMGEATTPTCAMSQRDTTISTRIDGVCEKGKLSVAELDGCRVGVVVAFI